MVDGCGVGGVGTKPRPLLSIEVSSLVRVQEDRFTQWSLFFYLIWSLFMLIIMIESTESTRFLVDNVQRIFILVTWA